MGHSNYTALQEEVEEDCLSLSAYFSAKQPGPKGWMDPMLFFFKWGQVTL